MPRAAGGMRKWFQFRLRMALVAIVLCSILFAAARTRIDSYRGQSQAFEKISPLAVYVSTKLGQPRFLALFTDPQTFSDVTHLSFHGQRKFDNQAASHLAQLPRLTRLSLHGTRVDDAASQYLSNLHELDTLSLKSTRIGDEGIRHLADLEKLRQLQLCGSRVTRDCVRYLAHWKHLEILEMSQVKLEDADIELLTGLPRLRQLTFSCDELTPEGYAHLSKIKTLKTITLYAADGNEISIQSLPQLSELEIHSFRFQYPLSLTFTDLPELTNLTLDVRRIDALKIERLPKLPRLALRASRLKPEVVVALGHLKGLRELSFSNARIPAENLAKLAVLPVEILELTNLGLTDADLEHLVAFDDLRSLNLSERNLRGSGLRWLARLPKLTTLKLTFHRWPEWSGFRSRRNPRENDAQSKSLDMKLACAGLAEIKTLKHLEVHGIPLDKDDFIQIARLPNLTHFVGDTTALSDEDFAEVSKLLPIAPLFEPERGAGFGMN